MKIEEARQIYNTQIRQYNEHKWALSQQREKLQKNMELSIGNKEQNEKEAVKLDLTIQALDEKQTEYQEYMAKLMEQWSSTANMVSSMQQGEAMGDAMEDLGKIMEVARRIMNGDIVPPSDERKLMEFSEELYQAAKNIAAMKENQKKDEHESLWEDEEPTEPEDPTEVANNTEAFADGPAVVTVEETVASVEMPSE